MMDFKLTLFTDVSFHMENSVHCEMYSDSKGYYVKDFYKSKKDPKRKRRIKKEEFESFITEYLSFNPHNFLQKNIHGFDGWRVIYTIEVNDIENTINLWCPDQYKDDNDISKFLEFHKRFCNFLDVYKGYDS